MGLLQLVLGLPRLGTLVYLLSHPVIVGFTSAAAIIIAASQFSKLLGVPMPRSDSFITDVGGVLAQIGHTHGATLAMGSGVLVALWLLRCRWPKLPGVLLVVAVSTAISWAIGFERNALATVEQIADADLRHLVDGVAAAVTARADLAVARLAADQAKRQLAERNRALRGIWVRRAVDAQGATQVLYAADNVPKAVKLDPTEYRIVRVADGALALQGGGEVVDAIPRHLPLLALPALTWELVGSLLSAAIVIALVGFMEAISIAKAIAARTRQRIDTN